MSDSIHYSHPLLYSSTAAFGFYWIDMFDFIIMLDLSKSGQGSSCQPIFSLNSYARALGNEIYSWILANPVELSPQLQPSLYMVCSESPGVCLDTKNFLNSVKTANPNIYLNHEETIITATQCPQLWLLPSSDTIMIQNHILINIKGTVQPKKCWLFVSSSGL